MTRFRSQIAAWLGLLAIGLNALTPLASLASSVRVDVGICTASGFRFAPEAPQAPRTVPSPAERSQCTLCAHCAPSSGHAALGSESSGVSPPWPLHASVLRRHVPALSAVHWIPGARPRAPPTPFALV